MRAAEREPATERMAMLRGCGRRACRRSGLCHAVKRRHPCHSPAAKAARDAEWNVRMTVFESNNRILMQRIKLAKTFRDGPLPKPRPRLRRP